MIKYDKKFIKCQFCLLRNHGVRFGGNRITFTPNPHIKSPLEIHVYAYIWFKNIGIMMKSGMNVYFLNLNHNFSERHIFLETLHGNFIYTLKVFCLKSAKRKTPNKKFFPNYVLMPNLGHEPYVATSNKLTHYLLDNADVYF